jgi:hypothetical protein
MKLSANIALLLVTAGSASAFLPHSVSASASRSSTSTTTRHATVEKTELIAPKSVAEMMTHADETKDMYDVNVQKTYG